MKFYDAYLRRLYRSGRPNWWAAWQNKVSALAFGAGVWPSRLAALDVRGRCSGKTITLPIVIAEVDGERYLVSMLGNGAGWVRNVRADDGRAVLRHGRTEVVRLDEVPVLDRPPFLKEYVRVAPGGRPHIPVDKSAPVGDFEAIAADYPAFRITPAATVDGGGAA